MFKENKNPNLKIHTPDGYKSFKGISLMGIKPIWRIELEDGIWIEGTEDHNLYDRADSKKKQLTEFKIGDEFETTQGIKKVLRIFDTGRKEEVFDIIGVEDVGRYYVNGIISSNCKFVTFEETLINSSYMSKIQPKPPLKIEGHVRWYNEIDPKKTYVVALDPSMGTGGDFAAIQVFELPTFKQIAEWQHNKTIIEGQMRVLKQILKDIKDAGVQDLYWSVESNSLGEAAMVVIRDSGEESFCGDMLHDNRRDLAANKHRMGFVTSNKSKIEACARFKSLFESGRMEIYSASLLNEMKNFIAKGNSYEARSGSHDDLISAVLLFLRMAQYISTWDEESQKRMATDIKDEDDGASPLPVLFC